MTSPILSLEAQLAVTLASVCTCRHLVTVHAEQQGACRFCGCVGFQRITSNDDIARDVLAGAK